MRLLEWALIQYDWCLYKRRFVHKHTQRKDRERAAISKPRREASEEISPTDTLILGFQPQGL